MWQVNGIPLPLDRLGKFEPIEMLDECGEPLIFTSLDAEGGLLLVYNLSASDEAFRYVAVVTTEEIVGRFRSGFIDVIDALKQPRAWIVDLSHDWQPVNLWAVDFDEIPPDVLPLRGVMLRPEFEPLFRLRLVGEGLGEGKTTASSLRIAAEATEDTLRRLTEISLNQPRYRGRSSKPIERFSNPVFQGLKAASLEIAFARPVPQNEAEAKEDARVIESMGKLLRAGLADSRGSGEPINDLHLNTDQIISLLEAVKNLTPAGTRGSDEVFVSGQLLGRDATPVRLTVESRREINDSLRFLRGKSPRGRSVPIRAVGRITQTDRDQAFFTLRNLTQIEILADPADSQRVSRELEGLEEVVFHYETNLGDEIAENVDESYMGNKRVEVNGVMRPNKEFLAYEIYEEGSMFFDAGFDEP